MNKKEERLAIIEMNISFLLLFLSPFHFVGGGFFCAIMFLGSLSNVGVKPENRE